VVSTSGGDEGRAGGYDALRQEPGNEFQVAVFGRVGEDLVAFLEGEVGEDGRDDRYVLGSQEQRPSLLRVNGLGEPLQTPGERRRVDPSFYARAPNGAVALRQVAFVVGYGQNRREFRSLHRDSGL